MKWIALVLMTGDHFNAALFGRSLPVLSELARVCFPLFAFVLVYNLSRPDVDAGRAMRRLLLVGCIAQPFHALAFGFFFPVNILFTFALGIFLASYRGPWPWVVLGVAFGVGGLLVDYQWSGLFLIVALAALFKAKPDKRWKAWALVAVALASLYLVNLNLWALAALPLGAAVIGAGMAMPRCKWLFYVYYPAHLAGLALLAANAGHVLPAAAG